MRGGRRAVLAAADIALVKPGDGVIIASYLQMDHNEARTYQPRLCFVDSQNRLR